MSKVTLSMRYKKPSNNGVGYKRNINDALKTLMACGYIFSQAQELHITTQGPCQVIISDPVRSKRAIGVIKNIIPTKLSASGKQRYDIHFSSLQLVPFVKESFSKHRVGVKVHDATGNEV